MPFFLDGNPTPGEISEAVNYVLANLDGNVVANQTTGQVIGPSGEITGYLYKYISIKYADSFDGTLNFSNTPTSRLYYGIRNSDSSVESTNPADYVWNTVTGGFGTTLFLWYIIPGGRQISFQVSATQPNPGWVQDSGTSIDLDYSTTAVNTPANFVVIRVANNSAAPTSGEVLAAIGRNAIDGDLCTINYNSGIASIVYKYTTGWAVFQKYITGDLIVANTITGDKIAAGSIWTNNLIVGSSPAISGTTMTGNGAYIDSTGVFALGNPSSNITNNGSIVSINGFQFSNASTNAPFNISNNTSSQTTVLTFNPVLTKPVIIAVTLSYLINTTYTSAVACYCATKIAIYDKVGVMFTDSSGSTFDTHYLINQVSYKSLRGSTSKNIILIPGSRPNKDITPPVYYNGDPYTIRVSTTPYFVDSSGNNIPAADAAANNFQAYIYATVFQAQI